MSAGIGGGIDGSGAATITLSGLVRAAYGTASAAHATNDPFCFLGDDVLEEVGLLGFLVDVDEIARAERAQLLPDLLVGAEREPQLRRHDGHRAGESPGRDADDREGLGVDRHRAAEEEVDRQPGHQNPSRHGAIAAQFAQELNQSHIPGSPCKRDDPNVRDLNEVVRSNRTGQVGRHRRRVPCLPQRGLHLRRRQAEVSIAQAQASLQRVIETAPLAIALFDARTLRVQVMGL